MTGGHRCLWAGLSLGVSIMLGGMAGLAQAWAGASTPSAMPAIPFASLTPDNFHEVLAPIARREGRLVLYNFAGNFDPVWRQGLIPRFEALYGVKVEYHNVRKDQANLQLIAIRRAGKAPPADVYFAGGPDNFATLAPALADTSLADLLPQLQSLPAAYTRRPFGIDTQGRWPIVHRSQLVLAYDSARIPEAQMPRSFEALLAWAESHPGQFALTTPAKGGSGAAFLYSAALRLVQDPGCRQVLADGGMDRKKAQDWAMDAPCLDPLWAYMGRLLKASELTNGNADTLNLMNNRQALIGTAWEDQTLTFVRARLVPDTLRVTALQPALASGGDGLVMLAGARSPAAALLFIDLAFSREFQAWKLDRHASRSPRADVGPADVSPATATHLLPASQAEAWSVPINWTLTRALTRAFEEKVLTRL